MADDAGFAPPPFKPDEALQRLKRDLRDAGLTEREGVFERRGSQIARLAIDDATIRAETVKKPSRNSLEWQVRVLKSGADLRDYAAGLKKQLAAWSDRDD